MVCRQSAPGPEPSLRHYVRARELKAAGMDWTEMLAAEDENPRARLAAELLASDAYGSTAERVQVFVAQGGGCRATFFNYRRKLGGGKGSGNGAGQPGVSGVLMSLRPGIPHFAIGVDIPSGGGRVGR